MTENTIDYIEFPACNLQETKTFFQSTFDWQFTDYGPDYTAFIDGRLNGGFFKADMASLVSHGAALVVLYTADINSTLRKVKSNGGVVTKDVFEFPGGCRFHFTEPSGNELAVWSDIVPDTK
ncbi:VOC family protein [Alteromonas facilis]|uniref:VOC family protein n=1 Tax=Alteromonas facilis TaxID=2048004 RepID=UPI000C28BEB8|nr:VOC family protein [Alteromonas facilis]